MGGRGDKACLPPLHRRGGPGGRGIPRGQEGPGGYPTILLFHPSILFSIGRSKISCSGG